MSKKKLTLVERAKLLAPKRAVNWFDRLAPDEQAALLEVRREWTAGNITASTAMLHELVKQDIPGVASRSVFRDWLRQS